MIKEKNKTSVGRSLAALSIGLLLLVSVGSVFAQEGDLLFETATQFRVSDRGATAGDIISQKNNELVRSRSPYDEDIFGVVATNPLMVIGQEIPDSLPIVTFGIALVRVDGHYEEIKKGDYITSSNGAGIGRKAIHPGFVVGRAMQDFNGREGMIEVLVDPRNVVPEEEEPWENITFWEAIGRIIRAMERDIPQILRYLLAALFAGGSFVFGLKMFSRTLKDGIKGISRNPLATGSIRFAMILNLIGILALTLSGLGLALFTILL